jgi:hypothetical protein
MMFVRGKKIDIVGRSSGNDTKNTYIYKIAEELNISKEDVEDAEKEYLQKYPDFKGDLHPSKAYSIAKNGKITLTIYSNLDELRESFTNYMIKDKILKYDSKIHLFEDGQTGFTDMVNEKKSIDRWEALIYIFGSRGRKFFNSNIYIYPNSSDLTLLNRFKGDLHISSTVAKVDDKRTVSNIDFYTQLLKDEVENKHFYISNWEEEFEFKTMIYLFSYFYEVETTKRVGGRSQKSVKERIKEHIQNISFSIFKEDGDFKSSLIHYSNGYKLFELFYQLKERELFKEFIYLFVNISLSKTNQKDPNLNAKRFVASVLRFRNFRKEIYETGYKTLKSNSSFGNSKMAEIIDTYLNFIGEEKEMTIHEQGKTIGKPIGYFAYQLGKAGKDLIFNLRNLKRHSQFVEYFRDLHFRILKESDKARFKKEFNETLEEVISDEKNWKTLRDYISIYAIQNFKNTKHHSEKGE